VKRTIVADAAGSARVDGKSEKELGFERQGFGYID